MSQISGLHTSLRKRRSLRSLGKASPIQGGGGGLPSYLGQVATRTRVLGAIYTPNKQVRGRTVHYARDNIKSPLIIFPNWYVDGYEQGGTYTEKGPGASATITAAIEYPLGSGNYTQLLFSGSPTGTIPNLGQLAADRPTVNIPKGELFGIRTFYQCSGGIIYASSISGGAIPTNAPIGDVFEAAVSGLADNTMGGAYGSGNIYHMYCPLVIADDTTYRSMIIYGDSRAFCEGDTNDATGDLGEVARAIGDSYGYMACATRGDALFSFLASSTRRQALAQYFSNVHIQLLINDFIRLGRTAAQVAASTQSVAALFPTKRVSVSTCLPSSTGTYTTEAGQTTASYNAARVTENNRRRATPAPFVACIDAADVVESARDSGIWKANLTADGVHPNRDANLAIKSAGVYPSNI